MIPLEQKHVMKSDKKNRAQAVKHLRLYEEDDVTLAKLRDLTLMKDTDILNLVIHAGMKAIRPHAKKRLQVPFEFALLDEDGNTMATDEKDAKKGRNIRHSRRDSNSQGESKKPLAPALANC